jgi:tubulin-specific chaperone A
MSQAEVLKQCKIKTNIMKRLNKELDYYKKEQEREQARVDKLREEGADLHGMKQAVRIMSLSSQISIRYSLSHCNKLCS